MLRDATPRNPKHTPVGAFPSPGAFVTRAREGTGRMRQPRACALRSDVLAVQLAGPACLTDVFTSDLRSGGSFVTLVMAVA